MAMHSQQPGPPAHTMVMSFRDPSMASTGFQLHSSSNSTASTACLSDILHSSSNMWQVSSTEVATTPHIQWHGAEARQPVSPRLGKDVCVEVYGVWCGFGLSRTKAILLCAMVQRPTRNACVGLPGQPGIILGFSLN